MRIELPLPSWAEAQRLHEDVHTLTVSAQRPLLPHPFPDAWPSQVGAARFEICAGGQAPLTLTF